MFTALINEMAIADVDDTIATGSQVLVMGHYHQSFLFLADQPCQELHDRFSVGGIKVTGWFISKDNGWREFAAKSEHLVWFNDLPKALSFFNEAGAKVAGEALARLRAGEAPETLADIERAFEYRLDDLDFHVDGWAPFEFEAQCQGLAEADLRGLEVAGDIRRLRAERGL